jgi:hypothetical protein
MKHLVKAELGYPPIDFEKLQEEQMSHFAPYSQT